MWENLAPKLVRQRLIIEGITIQIVKPRQIKSYLLRLAEVTNMEVISGPYVYSAHEMGFGGWVHWKTSGSHFYSYPTKPPLFTVDIYTCKRFSIQTAGQFTKKYLKAIKIVSKEIKV
jgi:hypothetical protein